MGVSRNIVLVAILVVLTGCARLEGGNWPSLHEGFTPREAPDAGASQGRSTDPASGPDQEQAPAAVPDALYDEVEEGIAELRGLLAIAEENASGENTMDSAGVGTPRQVSWYDAQLALTRMGRYLDALTPYPEARREFEGVLEDMRARLAAIEPE